MTSPSLCAAAVAAVCGARPTSSPPVCRDRFLWPFSPTSVWNTAIGSSAVYVPAGIYSAELPVQIHNDQEFLIDSRDPDTPLADWVDDSGNFPGMCGAKGTVKAQLPLPANFSTDCVANNNGAGVLLPDNVTLVQMQPLYRGEAGGPFIAWYHTGAPQPFPWTVDITGEGALGAHGGSGLSSFGGSLRGGELLGSTGPITHALKLELWAHRYYFYNYTSANYSSCYTWPAIGCDSYWDRPGIGYNGTNVLLKPGALLAVPPSLAPTVAANLTTLPARKIMQALVDYGGYLVDDTGSEAGGGAFCADARVSDEVQAEYGYSMKIEKPLSPVQGAELYWDLVNIYQALHVVANNGPGSWAFFRKAPARVVEEMGAAMGTLCKSNQDLFYEAASKGNTTLMNELLSKKGTSRANVNGRDKDGFTAMHLAAEGGHVGTVKGLIERQAKVDVSTDVGFTPLNLACKSGCDAVVKVLLAAGASLETTDTAYGCTALLWAVQYCQADTVKRLLEAGAKTEVKSRFGSTPLMQAAESGQMEKVKYLLESGANPKAKDSRGATALSKAKDKGNRAVADFIQLTMDRADGIVPPEPVLTAADKAKAAAADKAKAVAALDKAKGGAAATRGASGKDLTSGRKK